MAEIPPIVFFTYPLILEKIIDQGKARLILQIIVGAFRPLTLNELNVAYELAQYNSDSVYDRTDIDCEDNTHFAKTIRRVCGLFVTIHDPQIFLFHQNAREFLLNDQNHGLHGRD